MSYRKESTMRIVRTKHIVTISKGEFGSLAADMLVDWRQLPLGARLIGWEESHDGRIVEMTFEEEQALGGES